MGIPGSPPDPEAGEPSGQGRKRGSGPAAQPTSSPGDRGPFGEDSSKPTGKPGQPRSSPGHSGSGHSGLGHSGHGSSGPGRSGPEHSGLGGFDLKWADLPLLLAVAIVPLCPTQAGGLAVRILVFQVLALLALLALPFGTRGFSPLLRSPALGLDRVFLIWTGVAYAGLLVTPNLPNGLYSLGYLLALGLFYYAFTTRIRRPARALSFAAAAALAGTGIAAFELVAGSFGAQDGGSGRDWIGSILYIHSYLAGQVILPILILTATLAIFGGFRKGGWIALPACLIMAGYLFVIGSRGIYLAALLGGAVPVLLGILRWIQRRKIAADAARSGRSVWVALPLFVLIAALLFVASGSGWLGDAGLHAVERVESLFNPELSEHNFSRFRVWKDALALSLDSPLLGVGEGGFPLVFPQYHLQTRPVLHAHNQFMQILAEHGVIGLVCFLAVIVVVFLRIRRRMTEAEAGLDFALVAGSAGCLTAGLLLCVFETPLKWPSSALFFLVPLAVLHLPSRTEADENDPGESPGAHGVQGFPPTRRRWPWIVVAGLALIAWIGPARQMPSALASGLDGARGFALFQAGRLDEAADALAVAAAKWPCRPEILELKSIICLRAGRPEEGFEAAKASLALRPGKAETLTAAGQCLMKLKRYEEAQDYLRAAMTRTRGDQARSAYFWLGQAHRRAGEYEAALVIFKDLYAVPALFRVEVELWLEMAECMVRLRQDPALVLRLFQRAYARARHLEHRTHLERTLSLLELALKRFDLSASLEIRYDGLKARLKEDLAALDAETEGAADEATPVGKPEDREIEDREDRS